MKVRGEKVYTLAYAGDVVMMVESERERNEKHA